MKFGRNFIKCTYMIYKWWQQTNRVICKLLFQEIN